MPALSPWDRRNRARSRPHPPRVIISDPLTELRRVLKERADHISFIGIPTPRRRWQGKIQILWRDYLAGETGVLGTVPDEPDTITRLLNEIGSFKARATQGQRAA